MKQFAFKYISPWRRFLARYIDSFLMGAVGIFIFAFLPIWLIVKLFPVEKAKIAVSFYDLLGSNMLMMGIFAILTSALLNAMLMSITGSTIGKCLFGLSLRDKDNQILTFPMALRRELMIYSRGLAFGIPILSTICQCFSYGQILRQGKTSWDKKLNCEVIYKNSSFEGQWIIYRMVGSILFLLAISVHFILLSR